MSKIVNLFGGPGVGKSAIASGLVYELKKNHITCDNPYEFPKVLAWDNNHMAISDQLYVFANQHRGIVRSYNKVDYIILDSPILLSLVYKNYYNDGYPANIYGDKFNEMVMDVFMSYDNINIFLNRSEGKHNTKERFQTLEESLEIDNICRSVLDENNIPYSNVMVNDGVIDNIIKIIKMSSI